jgi:glycosyltransferase involved in cell wall biosynthesis
MKILHLITRLILGGAQQNTVMSCAAQVAAGHEVWLGFGPIFGPEGSLRDEAVASGATLIEMPTMVRPVAPWTDLRSYAEMRRIISRLRPDVVHTHSSKAGITGRAAAWHERVPAVVHTVHGLAFHERQSPLVQSLYVRLERYAAKRCHHLIAITEPMVDAFVAHGIAPRAKFTVVPSGVDLAKFSPHANHRDHVRRELRLDNGAPVVAILARLDPLKGHDDLLTILPRLVQRHPGLKLLFIGDGFDRKRLEQRIVREKLSEHVLVLGLVSHDEMPRLLTAVDVKVLPSYQEGQSRTLIEALLCGCGIVAYDVGGMPMICIDGQTGRLVPPGDRAALADAISWMLDHPDQRCRLVAQGQQHVREKFSAAAMLEQIEQVYRQVLEASPGGGGSGTGAVY